MAVVDRVLSRFGLSRKADPPAPPIINDGRGNLPSIRVSPGGGLPGAVWTPFLYLDQAREGYQRNTDVYACISLIATAGKQVKWWDGSGGSKSLTPPGLLAKHVLTDAALADPSIGEKAKAANPAPSITLLTRAGGASFIENWLSYLLLSGNDYIEIERLNGQPIGIFLNRPDRVTLPAGAKIPDRGREPAFWRVFSPAGGAGREVPATSMVHSKLFNPLDDVFGMAPLTAAMLMVDTQNEGATLAKRMLQRGYAPGWIEAKENSIWEEPQIAQLKERLKASKLAAEEIFLENATWHQMGFPPADSGIAEMKILSKRDIASVYHVPAQLIGDTASQTYSNYREARRALYMEAVVPLLVQFRDDWNRTIGRELRSPLDFDKDSFDAITAAREEATDRVVKLFTNGLITQNEGRADLEYDPVKGGDQFYASANFLPLGDGANPAVAAPAPPKAVAPPELPKELPPGDPPVTAEMLAKFAAGGQE
jgi:HK97 family phage portal protein